MSPSYAARTNDVNLYISQRKRPTTTSATTSTTSTATIDENDLEATTAPPKRKKRCWNHAKRSENGSTTARKTARNDRKTIENSPKTAEKEICIIGYMYRFLPLAFVFNSNYEVPGGLAVRIELKCFVSVSFSIVWFFDRWIKRSSDWSIVRSIDFQFADNCFHSWRKCFRTQSNHFKT